MKRSLAPSPVPGERAGCDRSCRESFRPERCSFALGSRPSPKPSLPAVFISSSSSLALPVASYSVTTMSEAMPGRWGFSGRGSRSSPGARWPQPPSRQRGRGVGKLPGTHDGMVRPTASCRPRCDGEARLQTQGGSAGLPWKAGFPPAGCYPTHQFIHPTGDDGKAKVQRRRMAPGRAPTLPQGRPQLLPPP